jgi:hypothetical protein
MRRRDISAIEPVIRCRVLTLLVRCSSKWNSGSLPVGRFKTACYVDLTREGRKSFPRGGPYFPKLPQVQGKLAPIDEKDGGSHYGLVTLLRPGHARRRSCCPELRRPRAHWKTRLAAVTDSADTASTEDAACSHPIDSYLALDAEWGSSFNLLPPASDPPLAPELH